MMFLGRSAGAEAEQLALRDARDLQDNVTRITDATGVPEGEWLVLIHGVKQDALDRHYLEAHTNAKGWQLGRLDYMREWKTCTRWLVFRSPRMVIVNDEGLRFLEHSQVAHLDNLEWRQLPVWEGKLGPDGDL